MLKSKPILALSSAFLYHRTLDTNLSLGAQAGFKEIELFLTRNITNLTLEEIKTAVEKHSLNLRSIHLPIPFAYNKEWPDLEQSIKKGLSWADELGAQWVVTHPLVLMADADDELKQAVKARYFRILAAVRELPGADRLLVENMPNLGMTRPIRNLFSYPDEFLETMISQGMKLVFDTTHWGSFDHDLRGAYHKFAPLVRNIHISDYLNGVEHIVPGEGELDMDGFMEELRVVGYSGQLTLELDFTTQGRNSGRDDEAILRDLTRLRGWMEKSMG